MITWSVEDGTGRRLAGGTAEGLEQAWRFVADEAVRHARIDAGVLVLTVDGCVARVYPGCVTGGAHPGSLRAMVDDLARAVLDSGTPP